MLEVCQNLKIIGKPVCLLIVFYLYCPNLRIKEPQLKYRMFYFILLIISISTTTNHCEGIRNQAIEEVYTNANKLLAINLKRSLNKIDKITITQAEKAIQICNNYEKVNRTLPASPDSTPPKQAAKELGLFVVGTTLSIIGINWLCGYEIYNMPEEFQGAILGIITVPLICGAYITSTIAYDKILHRSSLYKISLINEKLKESQAK